MHGRLEPDDYVTTALSALAQGPDCQALLDQLPVPLYTTDADGVLTYSNPAAAEFAGRKPKIGEDRWCVTARLYSTSGEAMPHDRCPMAEALKSKQPIRDQVAIAERPDGTRVAFRAFPTPIVGEGDEVVGGLNLLIDVTDEQQALLQEQAERCRRLADATYDRATSTALGTMADNYSKTAQELRKQGSRLPS